MAVLACVLILTPFAEAVFTVNGLTVSDPLLDGVIDRRFANLTAATQIVGERVTLDPEGLYREMQTWSDIRPDQLEHFRRAFLAERGKR